MAWLRFHKDTKYNKKGDIVWVEDEAVWSTYIKDKKNPIAVRCIGPNAVALEEAAPEDAELQLKREGAAQPKKMSKSKKK